MIPGRWQAWLRRPRNWVLLGFLAVAGYLAVAEHRAHLPLIAAVALLAACVAMNRYMHVHEPGDEPALKTQEAPEVRGGRP
ncbi:DUF2933 domain-containing protein [uncultured Meiothermus sp.]|jgi:4-hydroxybenzoate polyprenyltransferase|uniref:DUF2933 domain-containing protein n=1 Tax=uncultured Meiothermus sp. TaxID=157471 RepID=UPI002633A46C|nr:DUF2933 domain-containing protein [uncultured Meiothermus sp.]